MVLQERDVKTILKMDELHNSVEHPVPIEETKALGTVDRWALLCLMLSVFICVCVSHYTSILMPVL